MDTIEAYFSFFKAGQGAFYGGCISSFHQANPFLCWKIVYDCGTTNWIKGNSQSLNNEIDKFKNCCRHFPCDLDNKIDLLFISHFDYDHVSGVKRLLNEFDVKRVIIPYFPKELRKFALCSYSKNDDIEDDDTLLSEEDYFSFIEEPVSFIINLSKNTQVFLIDDKKDNEIEYGSYDSEQNDIYPVGQTIADLPDGIQTNNVTYYKNNLQFFIQNKWEFTTYVKEITNSQFQNLEADLKIIADIPNTDEITFENIKDLLVGVNRTKAHEKYKKHLSDLNAHGLVLLHGPINPSNGFLHGDFENHYFNHFDYNLEVERRTARYNMLVNKIPRLSTLLLGDTSLFGPYRIDFPTNFLSKLESLAVFQVPHHGSDKNWDNTEYINLVSRSNYFQRQNRILNVCNFGYGNKYGHPSHQVISDLIPNIIFNTQFTQFTTFYSLRYR